jgi:hypothetical protein
VIAFAEYHPTFFDLICHNAVSAARWPLTVGYFAQLNESFAKPALWHNTSMFVGHACF